MGGLVSEPDWKDELRNAVNRYAVGFDYEKEAAYQAVLPHIETAYKRGLMAGRSQAGYEVTRRKRKEEPCATAGAGAASPTPASTTEAGP